MGLYLFNEAYFYAPNMHDHGRIRSLKLLGGGGAVRGSEGHPAADDDLASEKGHLLAKRALFPTITGGGGAAAPPCPPPPPTRYRGTALMI